MQIKIVIGTISLMLTMMILGFSAIQEPGRLQEYTFMRQGRQIENGAHLYESNCATCHGVNGKVQECYDAATGEPIACAGIALNHPPLLCEDTSLRMVALNWQGSKSALIEATLNSGRYGTQMAAWAQRFGGPLRDDEIQDLVQFILNWETEELCSEPPEPAYDWPESVEDFFAEYPEGDPARGAELFAIGYSCAGCHGNFASTDWAGTGPWIGIVAEVAPRDLEGYTPEQYVYESILYPNDYLVEGYDANIMTQTFPLLMGDNPQDMADVIAYIFGGGEGE